MTIRQIMRLTWVACLAWGCASPATSEAPTQQTRALGNGPCEADELTIEVPQDAPLGAGSVCVSSTFKAPCVDGVRIGERTDVDGDEDVCVPHDDSAYARDYAVCSNSMFFIERPRWLVGGVPPAPVCEGDLDGCLEALLPVIAAENGYAWFCDLDDAPCGHRLVTDGVVAHVESVFTADEPAGLDLMERAYRVWFETGGDRIPVRDTASCDFISTLRAFVLEDSALIGRECDAMMQRALGAADPSSPYATWHRDRMQLDGAPEGEHPVPVLVLDAGAPPGAVPHRTRSLYFSGLPLGAPVHPHGVGISLAVSLTGGNAVVQSVRVLDTDGDGNTADIARGIHSASGLSPARVINLSLGFPPELRAARPIRGPLACETVDDGAGEAIAIALQAVQAREPDVVAFAAAGNRPLQRTTIARQFNHTAADSLRFDDPCYATFDKPLWFFPASLQNCNEGLPIIGVGGTSDRGLPMAVSVPEGEPMLVAPGESIYLDSDAPWTVAAYAPPSTLICSAPTTPRPELPMLLTGTSLSTAFVSGAAARALGRRPGLDATVLTRLIYMTGRPACRAGVGGAPVRHLSVERMMTALDSPGWVALRTCLSRPGPTLYPALHAECLAALHAAGVDDGDCATYPPVGWPAGHDRSTCVMKDGSVDPTLDPVLIVTPDDYFAIESVAKHPSLAGKAGPQPGKPDSPDVDLHLWERRDVGAPPGEVESATLYIDLTTGFGVDATFHDPMLIVKSIMTDDVFALDLSESVDASTWMVGDTVKIEDVPFTKFPGGDTVDAWKTDLVPEVQMLIGGYDETVLRSSGVKLTVE